jgi:DNA-binding transcriptional LysR family regulator
MSDPVETAELVAFTKTVDAKSLSRAAAELRVPRATVSRRLARLEERLGAHLLRRTTRRLVLTDIGEVFYRQACIALESVRLAEQSVRMTDDVVRGDLCVSVPPMMSVSFHTMLREFARRYPELRVHIDTSNRLVDILHGGYDVSVQSIMGKFKPAPANDIPLEPIRGTSRVTLPRRTFKPEKIVVDAVAGNRHEARVPPVTRSCSLDLRLRSQDQRVR